MLTEIKSALLKCPVDAGFYLINALSERSGFFYDRRPFGIYGH